MPPSCLWCDSFTASMWSIDQHHGDLEAKRGYFIDLRLVQRAPQVTAQIILV